MSRQIHQVSFHDYVHRPENQHNTNVLRLSGADNSMGVSAMVDTMVETPTGILVTKVSDVAGTKKKFTSLYPWHLVKDVKYESEVLNPPPEVEPVINAHIPEKGKAKHV